ncbi:hypothetical protein LIER_18885 [Lithospermum erythrorhizon]|uniref:Retrotransposon gag domain-containing protein n=1 Tax=Lithospermum erythrorhizon TaxID=34254 RepID=A0AAV3QHZ6_LITER
MLKLRTFDIIGDPSNHLKAYDSQFSFWANEDDVYARAFPGSLSGATLKWFLKLPPNSIDCWKRCEVMLAISKVWATERETSVGASVQRTPIILINGEVHKTGRGKKKINPKIRQRGRSPRRENGRIRRPQEPMHISYTLMSTTIGRVYAQIEDRKILPKPQKLRSPPNRRDQKQYYECHRDHGHDTDDCRLLKAEIEKFIQRGHLKEFVKRNQQHSPRRQRESPRRNNKPRSLSPPQITGRIDKIAGGLLGGGDTSNSRKQYAGRVVYRFAPMATIDREGISFS